MNFRLLNRQSDRFSLAVLMGMVAFWVLVFIINAGPHWEIYSSPRELIETAGLITALQLSVALVALNVLVPKYLSTGKWFAFLLGIFVLVIAVTEVNILVRYLYLEERYPDSYKNFLARYGDMTLSERMSLFWTMRYIVFSKVPLFILPATLLLAYSYYREQQIMLQIREQKRTAELGALKNQLNPHFIFNTLNNIYALALKKSDQAPAAIAKLSSILDYVVYRCNQQYVDFQAELSLIEDYIALEKLRYGQRVKITVDNQVTSNPKIAPLLILTLIENACKHSAREELNQASVAIRFTENDHSLTVTVTNTKPERVGESEQDEGKVGLQNLRKQLELLYRDAHKFTVSETNREYKASLTLGLERSGMHESGPSSYGIRKSATKSLKSPA